MKNLNLGVLLLAVLLGACNGAELDMGSDVGQAGASSEAIPVCVVASPEAGADVTLCPGLANVQIVTTCDTPAANPYPHDKFSDVGCDETAFQGGRVWCCAPPAPAPCEAVVEERGDGWTFQGVGWADHVVPDGTCMWMTALNANQARSVAEGPANVCEAPNHLTDAVREVQALGAGDRTTRIYCGAADGCIVEWRAGNACPADADVAR